MTDRLTPVPREASNKPTRGNQERGELAAPVAVDWGQEYLGTVGRKVVSALGIVGDLFAMLLDAVWSTVSAIVHRRFSWAEFIEQTWFLISVTVLPAVLIAIPFGLVLVLEVGGLAVQIGAVGDRRRRRRHRHRS